MSDPIKRHPTKVSQLLHQAETCRLMGHPREAIIYFTQAIDEDPKNYWALGH
ncbi:hypothetical protein [Laspinema palackyanum]|uniref:hypothetical protein n=1 Tax=Laspinema palackyanum TaxID=3231601 RepID=UPI00345D3842|nr:tetratricopeptide repeat protein [Laspinema sp. D2c]